MNVNQEYLCKLSSQANQIMRKHFEICAPLYKEDSGVPSEVQFVVGQLYSSCYTTSESALILIANYRLWDTEILVRSITEGTIKFIFLCLGSESDIEMKADEYWNILPDIQKLKWHKKVNVLLSKLDDISYSEPKTLHPLRVLLLSQDEIDEIEKRYSKKYCHELEKKWSFNQILNSFSSSEIRGLGALKGLYHYYSIGSHMIHHDGDALSLIWDRNQRGSERREALEMAHASRELSDILSLSLMRVAFYYKLYKLDRSPINEIRQMNDSLHQQLHAIYEDWFDVEY